MPSNKVTNKLPDPEIQKTAPSLGENQAEIIHGVVEQILYSHIPGHEKGRTLKIGQLDKNISMEQIESKISEKHGLTMTEQLQSIQASRVREEWIPEIIQQLTSVVIELGESADNIINASEELEVLTGSIEGPLKNNLERNITQLIEFSSFHDLSNQRLQQVIRLLAHIEITVDGLMGAMGDSKADKRYHEKNALMQKQKDENQLLKQGPQKQDSTTQDKIDHVFDS